MKVQTLFCLLLANIYGITADNGTLPGGMTGGLIFHTNLIGGNDAQPNKWPWHAALYTYDEFSCSATLISNQWIVTAAHCLFNALNRKILDFRYGVRLGIHMLTTTDPNEQMKNVSKSIVHPNFQYISLANDPGQLIPIHDIGLLQLATPAIANNNVQWIQLPAPSYSLKTGDSVYATGWGYIYQDIEGRQQIYNVTGWGIITTTTTLTVQPDALQQLQMTIDATKNCAAVTQNSTDMICVANPVGGTGPCQGDSGGPLVAQKNKKWILYGVSSFGPQPCAPAGITGVYTKVASNVRWILNVTQT